MMRSSPVLRALLPSLLALLAAVAYLHDLGSPHIPKNGDEYPYTHITRLTAASGSFLPLRSALVGVRNTKPPLLFWQGIVSTDWGRSFQLWNLRYPCVAYTFLTALLVFLLGRRLGADAETGAIAALAYLCFFSTYRYGRPFLTNAPEVFWLWIPFFALLYWRPASFASRVVMPGVIGVALGLGLLYKSFALAVPVGAGLALWYLRSRRGCLREFFKADLPKVGLTLSLALAIFAGWFALDPEPGAVWNEFVLGENVGKFQLGGSYLPGLLWGRFSLPSLAIGFLLNAGLLVLPVGALMIHAWRRRRELSEAEQFLWLWILTLFVVYCAPSQRSSRYLLPAMPAVAILLGLYWPRLGRGILRATLLLAGLLLGTIAALSLLAHGAVPDPPLHGPGHWLLLAGSAGVVACSLLVVSLMRWGVLASALLVLLSLSSLLGPLDGTRGRFADSVREAVAGREVWVPVDFIGKEEGYRQLLPGARVRGYRGQREVSLPALLERYPLLVARVRPGDPLGDDTRLLGERLDLRGRHSGAEIRELLGGEVAKHLFVREVLVERR